MAVLKLLTPVGELTLVASDSALLAVHFPSSRMAPPPRDGGLSPSLPVRDGSLTPLPPLRDGDLTPWPPLHDVERGNDLERSNQVLARARQQLEEYFAGARTTFDLPLDAAGSEFQHRVWDALRAIPYGTTVSYSEIARRLGDVRTTRAVGAANGQNPIPIIVPCHRVVGANGELTGFGGGVDRKRWLLEHEGALLKLGG